MKKLCAALFATLVAISSTAFGKDIRVAIDATSPPFESIAPDGKLQGFDIDLMNALCKRIDEPCNLIAAEWNGMIPGLISGKYDVLISALNITEERKKAFSFTTPYMYPRFAFVGKKGDTIQITPDGLKGKVIGVQLGTPQDAFVTAHFGKEATIKRYSSGSAPFLDLTNGRVDLVFNLVIQIQQTFLNKPENAQRYGFVGPVFASGQAPELGEGVAIAVGKQNTELLAKLNDALAKMKQDGSFKAINDKYFTYDVSALPKK
ncbi:transporter substrate-binding domain-containing protein [Paraburkholderia sp. CNPSo 3274]|uniref:transporter substrate-binding domain-containing protein n=1 Tax=Paraburkholderia sp. CNPSo 3274 TaxID=2940932 RepID=UPI0020B879AF|nr:transporter substrate-binding domain-containing protein [Paraburkholderia sp. CNPSo 3274]MCP3712364.1 transporter substrate-binding domain-containing protein [Paraburkholderia sp. CNPSo 3274]